MLEKIQYRRSKRAIFAVSAALAHLLLVAHDKYISQLTNLCTGIRSQPPPISRHPFRCSFGCVLLWNQIYLVHNVLFDNITPIYLINLPWKLGLGLGLDLKMHYFSIFHGE